MVRLEDPRLGSWVKGVLPDALVQVIDAAEPVNRNETVSYRV